MKRSTESFWRKELRLRRKQLEKSLQDEKYYDSKADWEYGIAEQQSKKNKTDITARRPSEVMD